VLEQAEIIRIMRDAIYTILIVAGPTLIVGMAVGVAISIFQATTQINEQALSFVPKIVAIFLTIILFGGWMLSNLSDFTNRLYAMINEMLK
jgi:flagellar biosynthetic protein FliQ